MPIREESFRMGCGRYIQKQGALSLCGEEIARLGTAPLIVGGKTALEQALPAVLPSVRAACERHTVVEHGGTCNERDALALAELAARDGYDVIVGVGGGVIMDFAKLIANSAGLPVVNVPTSSATCAAYTPLSVCYTPEGKTVGTKHFEREVDAVIVDTALLAKQPVRLLLAGVFDALAKFIEIKQRFTEQTTAFPLGLNFSYALAKCSFDELVQQTEICLRDMQSGVVSDAVERVIFAAIAATGSISGIARGSNQTALAHKFYELTRERYPERSKPYLHGEIVGVGLLLQSEFNQLPGDSVFLKDMMLAHRMPMRITDIGVDNTEETRTAYFDRLCQSSAMQESSASAAELLDQSLRKLWEL